MSETEQHRGAHPADKELFAVRHWPVLRAAVRDLSWLFSRGYAAQSALKLVGDRYTLKLRQRLAVARAAASKQQLQYRRDALLPLSQISGQDLILDGFNLIITMEAALSGGVIVVGQDGCFRDLSSVHGSYRSVAETEQAIELIGQALMQHQPASALWLLDQPVSNSGRLAGKIRAFAAERQWPWEVEVVMNPDRVIRDSSLIAVTADSNVLDGVQRWINVNRVIVEQAVPSAWVIDLQTVDSGQDSFGDD